MLQDSKMKKSEIMIWWIYKWHDMMNKWNNDDMINLFKNDMMISWYDELINDKYDK